jgi:hypothetical protein
MRSNGMVVAQDLKLEKKEMQAMADEQKDEEPKAVTAFESGDRSTPCGEIDEADVWSRTMSSWFTGWTMPEEFMRYGRPNRKAKTEPITGKVG